SAPVSPRGLVVVVRVRGPPRLVIVPSGRFPIADVPLTVEALAGGGVISPLAGRLVALVARLVVDAVPHLDRRLSAYVGQAAHSGRRGGAGGTGNVRVDDIDSHHGCPGLNSPPMTRPPIVELPARADVVIVGAGHNGLVAATLLARAGLSVLVLEAADVVGGAARTEYPFAAVPKLAQSTGAYLLGLMPPELPRLLGVDIPTRRRDPHYFLPTPGPVGSPYLLSTSDPI